MPTSIWSNWAGNRALLGAFGNSRWLALHRDDPGDGNTATEVAGAGYHRQLVHWSMPSGKALANTDTPIFDSMPACTVLWLAVWTQRTGGEMVAKQQLATPMGVPQDGQVRMAKHDIAWAV